MVSLQGNGLSFYNQFQRIQNLGTINEPVVRGIPTLITWSYGGNHVAVEGSWDNWRSRWACVIVINNFIFAFFCNAQFASFWYVSSYVLNFWFYIVKLGNLLAGRHLTDLVKITPLSWYCHQEYTITSLLLMAVWNISQIFHMKLMAWGMFAIFLMFMWVNYVTVGMSLYHIMTLQTN